MDQECVRDKKQTRQRLKGNGHFYFSLVACQYPVIIPLSHSPWLFHDVHPPTASKNLADSRSFFRSDQLHSLMLCRYYPMIIPCPDAPSMECLFKFTPNSLNVAKYSLYGACSRRGDYPTVFAFFPDIILCLSHSCPISIMLIIINHLSRNHSHHNNSDDK